MPANVTCFVSSVFAAILICASNVSAFQESVTPQSPLVHEETDDVVVDEVWISQESGSEASLRGLHVVDAQIVWASGSEGTVLRTVDAGESWTSVNVEGAEELDFRDVHAHDANRAVIISAGTPARIYHTDNGGESWEMVFEHPHEKAFFDALSFLSETEAIVMSDPVDERVLLVRTSDGGKTWAEAPAENRPEIIPGEGGFAASGTNMRYVPGGNLLIAFGAAKEGETFDNSRIAFSGDNGMNWEIATAPVPRSAAGGIFSMCFVDRLHGVVVGGDYLDPARATGNAAITSDGGRTWTAPTGTTPGGYRSCVAPLVNIGDVSLIAVGPDGTDISHDLGNNWAPVSTIGFHSVQFAPSTAGSVAVGWATGSDGRIAKWNGSDR